MIRFIDRDKQATCFCVVYTNHNNHSSQFTFGLVTCIELADKRIDLEKIYKYFDTKK